MKRPVKLVTCTQMPEPDPDAQLLLDAVRAQGVDAEWVAWDAPGARFDGSVAVIRSTWNYFHKVDSFLKWVDSVSAVLWNPTPVVRWNSHKSYLLELACDGVPTVPTKLLRKGSATALKAAGDELRAEQVVVKPAVSGGSFETIRVDSGDAAAEKALRALVQTRDVLVQPYLSDVEKGGERALVWIDGEFTHAVRKNPRFKDDAENVSQAVPIADDERKLAELVLSQVKEDLLYARVDMVRDGKGKPLLMELELIEPSLFLRQDSAATERFARAMARLSAQ